MKHSYLAFECPFPWYKENYEEEEDVEDVRQHNRHFAAKLLEPIFECLPACYNFKSDFESILDGYIVFVEIRKLRATTSLEDLYIEIHEKLGDDEQMQRFYVFFETIQLKTFR